MFKWKIAASHSEKKVWLWLVENVDWCRHVEITWKVLEKLKLGLPYDPAVLLLGTCLERTIIQEDICTVFTSQAMEANNIHQQMNGYKDGTYPYGNNAQRLAQTVKCLSTTITGRPRVWPWVANPWRNGNPHSSTIVCHVSLVGYSPMGSQRVGTRLSNFTSLKDEIMLFAGI